MDTNIIYKHIISSLYKMLCWREEGKHWFTIYDELLREITFNDFPFFGANSRIKQSFEPCLYQ